MNFISEQIESNALMHCSQSVQKAPNQKPDQGQHNIIQVKTGSKITKHK